MLVTARPPVLLQPQVTLPERPLDKNRVLVWSEKKIDEVDFVKLAQKSPDRESLVRELRNKDVNVIFFRKNAVGELEPAAELNRPRDAQAASFYASRARDETRLLTPLSGAAEMLPRGGYHSLENLESGIRRPLADRPLILALEDTPRDILLHEAAHAFIDRKGKGPQNKIGNVKVDDVTMLRQREWELIKKHAELFLDVDFGGKTSFTPEEVKALAERQKVRLRLILAEDEVDVAQLFTRRQKELGTQNVSVAGGVLNAELRISGATPQLRMARALLPLAEDADRNELSGLLTRLEGKIGAALRWSEEQRAR